MVSGKKGGEWVKVQIKVYEKLDIKAKIPLGLVQSVEWIKGVPYLVSYV